MATRQHGPAFSGQQSRVVLGDHSRDALEDSYDQAAQDTSYDPSGGDTSGSHPSDGDDAGGDLHPSCGLVTDLMQRYLGGELDKDAAMQQFSRILDLYPSGDLSAETESAATRRLLHGRSPAPKPFDAKKARAELYGRRLAIDAATGERVLESAGGKVPGAPRYDAGKARQALHAKPVNLLPRL